MGCCISKCRPDKHSLKSDQFNHHHHLEDKLVISQAPPTPSTQLLLYSSSNNKISPSPPSPTSSISSFTCNTSKSNSTLSSASSFSSASSAALSSKDRSFSNEFLWSCYKDNPHITRIHSLRDASTLSFIPTKPNNKPDQSRKIIINPSPTKKSPVPLQKDVVGSFSMPQKRVRSNSPTNLTRQKSFRKEPLRPITMNSAFNVPSRMLGSPSPSRRFNAAALATDNSVSKRTINSPKVSVAHYSRFASSSIRKEGVKAASPNDSLRQLHSAGLKHRETCTFGVGSKIDETVVKDVLSSHDMDSTMEDIDNPLISLDCFIFL